MHILNYPPLRVYKFSNKAFQSGIEDHQIDGVKVRIYSPEKTLVDCFKYRNKIGMDVVLEALKLYKARKIFNYPRTTQICWYLPHEKYNKALSGGNSLNDRLLTKFII